MGGEQLSAALAELSRAAALSTGEGEGDAEGEGEDDSDDEPDRPPPPIVISEADFREKGEWVTAGLILACWVTFSSSTRSNVVFAEVTPWKKTIAGGLASRGAGRGGGGGR